MRRSNGWLVTIVIVVGIAATACVVPWSDPTYTYTVQSDIVYGQGEVGGGGTFEDLLLDLYIPDLPVDEPMALMLMIHGGGFTTGNKSQSAVVNYAVEYAQRGWLVASIDYRLVGDDPVPSARVQPLLDHLGEGTVFDTTGIAAAVDDTLTALDFLHARDDVFARWTTLWGRSAGAITALVTGYALDDHGISRPPVASVVGLWGGFYGAAVGTPFDDPTDTDPVLHVVHGTADPVVDYSYAQEIETWANDAGLPLDFYPVNNAGHGINIFNREASPGVSLFQRSIDWHHETLFANLPQGPLIG